MSSSGFAQCGDEGQVNYRTASRLSIRLPGQTRRDRGGQCQTSARYAEIRIGEPDQPDQSPTVRRSSIAGRRA
jgi:hypothetical protein